jgi:hypothetical protein
LKTPEAYVDAADMPAGSTGMLITTMGPELTSELANIDKVVAPFVEFKFVDSNGDFVDFVNEDGSKSFFIKFGVNEYPVSEDGTE